MKRTIISILSVLLIISGLVVASSLQDSQTGFRNITRTPDVTADISGTENAIDITDNGDGTLEISISSKTRYLPNLVSTLTCVSVSVDVTMLAHHARAGRTA